MLDRLKNLARGASDLFKAHLSGRLLESLKTGSLFITESVILEGLRSGLSGHGISVESLSCTGEGVTADFVKRLVGATLDYTATIKVLEFEISAVRHEVVLQVVDDRLAGDNLWSKIVASLITLLVKDIVAGVLSFSDVEKTIRYESSERKAFLDLYDIPAVQALYTERPILRRRIVDFVSIEKCVHESGGLRVFASFTPGARRT